MASRAAISLPISLLLAACSSGPEPQGNGQPSPLQPPLQSQPLQQQQPGLRQGAASPKGQRSGDGVVTGVVPGVTPPAGLTPLPSPQQVVEAQVMGRADPFLPVAATAGKVPVTPLPLPEGFRFNGVIRSGGQVQALVQLGADSGSLRVGDAGGRHTKLLPTGWSVNGIDVQRGRLTLRFGGRLIPLSLDAALKGPSGPSG